MKPQTTLLAALASLSTLVSAAPYSHSTRQLGNTTASTPSNFYLVTTTQSTPSSNSSALQDVSLTTLFDPYYQPNYLLRLIDSGYGSVPTFNLSDGVLHCREQGPHGIGSFVFNSTDVQAGSELQFIAQFEGHGDLSLKEGYLLAVNGSEVGWTICTEELGQSVVCWIFSSLCWLFSWTADVCGQIEFKGTDESCTPTYIQAVSFAPY